MSTRSVQMEREWMRAAGACRVRVKKTRRALSYPVQHADKG